MRQRTPLTSLLAATTATGGLLLTGAGPATASAASASAASASASASASAAIEVSTAAQLKTALGDARPGDTIHLADGTYTGNFKATTPATSGDRITLTGSPRAVLTAGGGYGLHLDGASYWTVSGLTVTGGQKGIVIDTAKGVVVDGVTVHGLDMEGVHFRKSSPDGVIENSTIYDTGNDGRGMGEGVYVGTANTLSDRSDDVRILDNTIGPDVGGENVDIKEGTTGAQIIGNVFDGSGLTGANYDDSWVDVKGNDVLVQDNTGTNTTNDGYQTHTQRSGWGCGAVFKNNHSDLTGATGDTRLAVDVTNYKPGCTTTVYDSNTVTAGKGLTNIPVTS